MWPTLPMVTFETVFYVDVFPILDRSYWWVRNKQPIEIAGQISPRNQTIAPR